MSTINVNIIKIREEEFSFKQDNIANIDPRKLEVSLDMELTYNSKTEHCFLTLTVHYTYKSNDKPAEIVKFATLTEFEAKGINSVVKIKENEVEFPDQLVHTFIGTSISTTRGMLVYKLAGTLLADSYLPFINVEKIPIKTIQLMTKSK